MTERELERQARHRLAVLWHAEEISGNVSATCRYYGISRNCFYKWLRRYEAEGLAGLRDRSSKRTTRRRPPAPRWSRRSCGCASTITSARRRSRCTCSATTMYRSARRGCGASSSGWALTGCRPRSGTSAMTAAGSGMKAAPGPPAVGRCQVHRAARPARSQAQVLPIHRDRRLHPAADLARLPALRPEDRDPVHRLHPGQLPFAVERVQTDNGQEFGASFHWHLLDKGIDHVYISPAPRG
jgi:transposase-like protein